MFRRIALLLDSIKFAHSVFALPFALVAMIVAAGGWPSARVAALIVICMISARSAAMAFNRLADRDLDAANPRTRSRPSVNGALSQRALVVFMLGGVAVFWTATWFLNTLCFELALPVLGILLGYSLSKRFTMLCHFWLGLALGLAPIAAHLAVRGNWLPLHGLGARFGLSFEAFPFILGLTVLCWVAGFDIIYACQDYEHDRSDPRVHSIPKAMGIAKALSWSSILHSIAVVLLLAAGWYAAMGPWFYVSIAAVAALLIYEHRIVRPNDLSRVNVAFFTINGLVSLLLLASVFIERVLLR